MMNPRRFVQVASALCGTAVLASWAVSGLADYGSAGLEKAAGAVPIAERSASPHTANAMVADAPQATATDIVTVTSADVAAAVEATVGTMPLAPESIVEAALSDPSQVLPSETAPVEVATASTPDPVPTEARGAVRRIEILDECLVAEICIDQYLWALYQRTPKHDTMKVHERRKVAVKKKRKTVTVTRTFTKLVPQDFTWKDPHAAEKIGMPMMDYVIGGMDRNFKLRLFHMLHAAEAAGLSPGITSAFRDDYRQSIASGLKAASDRSFHGGSFRGGYGHGLAADIVSVKGATKAERWVSTEILWKWVDAHGKEFGIGRPYLGKDPPHVAPIDGREYVSRRGTESQQAEAQAKRNRLAARNDHSVKKNDRGAKKTSSAQRGKTKLVVARAQVRN